ncbi:MAG: Cell division protein ftsk/spoiiie [uncultured bacterium]|nr:MAG: Cell division protein ftsk/spoiiie [uncultured bacterium]HBR71314.1 hypothetical protein [Candidatus Moranbacteria bacterium]
MEQKVIGLEKLYADKDWKEYERKPVIPIGAETETHNLVGNLENAFNLLIGGKTGSGKSNFFHCAIASLLKNTEIDELKFILIDTKRVELIGTYNDLPNLMFPVAVTYDEAKEALQWCLDEIDRRFKVLAEIDYPFSVEEYNKRNKENIPRIVVVIDEFSDLMIEDFEFYKKAVLEILNSGPLAGVSIMIGTSKILETVYPKELVDAFRYRIAFATARAEDSRIILGFNGAEKLRGDGEMLALYPEVETPVNAQGFYISEDDIEKTKEQYIQKYTFKPES